MRKRGGAVKRRGQGAEARNGHVVRVHYTGWLYDHAAPEFKKAGEPFDSPNGAAEFAGCGRR